MGSRWFGLWFALILALHLAAVVGGWNSPNLSGNEFRQAQTALSAHFIQHDGYFGLDYPTPVLGKPWSVPFEFPLYQWTVVGLSNATGYPLLQSGRLVSVACFYLALPAVWLLLGRLGVERSRRWIVLGLVLTCPIHVFYVRAFLIETMALLFALWFLAAFVAALEERRPGWFLVANVAGVGAGLVKVTTFAVVLGPAAAWALALWWRDARAQPANAAGRRTIAGWATAGAALLAAPLAASVWWVQFADAVKARNPAAGFALSGSLSGFNFGPLAERLGSALWLGQAANILQGVAGPWVLGLCAAALLLASRRRGPALAALAAFALPPLVFPLLYKIHDYYFLANAVFLAAACGLAVAALADRPRTRWLAAALLLVLPVLQARSYFAAYREMQTLTHQGGGHLTRMLAEVTAEDDVLVIAGRDWNAMVPFHAGRRALMFHGGSMDDANYVARCFDALAGESVGALVLHGQQRNNALLRELAVQRFGLDARPLFSLDDDDVYVPAAVRPSALDFLHTVPVATLRLPPPAPAGEDPWRGKVVEPAKLPMVVRRHFKQFTPEPVRSQSTFAYSSTVADQGPSFSLHPDTRLWFVPPARRCCLETSFLIYAGAYEGKKPGEGTDGVQFNLTEVRPDGTTRTLYQRLLNPMEKAEDRGLQLLALDLEVGEGSELLFESTAGPAGNMAFDWATLIGPFTLRPAR